MPSLDLSKNSDSDNEEILSHTSYEHSSNFTISENSLIQEAEDGSRTESLLTYLEEGQYFGA